MDPSHDEPRNGNESLINELMRVIEERLDVESLAHAVEHLDHSRKLAEKLRSAFGDIRGEVQRIIGEMRARMNRSQATLAETHREIRDLILDVALLKHAASSAGQVGVLERRKVERELVLELLPPTRPREGTGVRVAVPVGAPTRRVDCKNRLHLCKAACCRIFDAPLTADEVESDRYDWDPKRPYSLRRERVGCVHLRGGTCECSVYHDRPLTCQSYSCENDGRIWSDFTNRILNPELASRLVALDVVTIPGYRAADPPPAAAPATAGGSNPAMAAHTPAQETFGNGPDLPARDDAGRLTHATVAPPNFDDLRELVVPRPTKVFVAPLKEANDGHNHTTRK